MSLTGNDYPPAPVPSADQRALTEEIGRCRACDLWEGATQPVLGEGPLKAHVMLVGEQPGDREDIEGHPFVGPAGRVLDAGLERAGIARGDAYVTNVVKHFRYKQRGKRRIHQTPDRWQVNACLPWLRAERALIAPAAIVLLGATAAQALLGPSIRIGRDRGRPIESDLAELVTITAHPSSILRARDDPEREQAMEAFVADLRRWRSGWPRGSRRHRRVGRDRPSDREGIRPPRRQRRADRPRSSRPRGRRSRRPLRRRPRTDHFDADVADADAVERRPTQIERELGPIDIWVNNAMTTVFAFFDDVDPAEYERATKGHLPGHRVGDESGAEAVEATGPGTIVQVGSALAYRGIPCRRRTAAPSTRSRACSSRSAASCARTEQRPPDDGPAARAEHAAVRPLPSRMPRHPQPVKPIFQPEVAARAVYWAAHHRRRELYVGFRPCTRSRQQARAVVRRAVPGEDRDRRPAVERAVRRRGGSEPVRADRRAPRRGRAWDLRHQAHARSPQAWLSRHRLAVGLAAVAATAATGAAALARRD